jgi:hypothetical protein
MLCSALELENRGRWRLLLLAATLLWGPAQAMTVEADIKGDTFRWVSAQSSFNDGVAPSVWATPAQLVPAGAFVPGGNVLRSLPVNLVGPEGDSVSLPLDLLGMEYNSPEATSVTTDSGGGTASVNLSGSLVQVQGSGLGNRHITLAREVTPFTHARPVISLGSSASILLAFRNANAAPGIYTTQVSLPQAYEYERAGVRIRHNWTLPLTISITYAPSILTDITLTSPTLGMMTARYYSRGGVQYTAGEAVYNGVASGFFTNGLRLRMKTGDVYQMSGPDTTAIPFSVTCGACAQPLLVDKGNLTLADLTTTGTRIAGVNASVINFVINIDFTDVEVSTLRSGAYQGMLSMLFEPDV